MTEHNDDQQELKPAFGQWPITQKDRSDLVGQLAIGALIHTRGSSKVDGDVPQSKCPLFMLIINCLNLVEARFRSHAHCRHEGLEGSSRLTSAGIVEVVRGQRGCPAGQHLDKRPGGQLQRGMWQRQASNPQPCRCSVAHHVDIVRDEVTAD